MSENPPSEIDLAKINQGIADRSDVFYWQTDRRVDPVEAGAIWADRHRYFEDGELLERLQDLLPEVAHVEPISESSQNNLGNVNSVRTVKLQNGREAIVRCHPKGIKNGYFHAEATAAARAHGVGIPTYETFAVHDFDGSPDDFAFHVIEKMPGTAMKFWLDEHPQDEDSLVYAAGAMMARVHRVSVDGYGPFNNNTAKNGELHGLHSTFAESVRAGLEFNIDSLIKNSIITSQQGTKVRELYTLDNPLLNSQSSVLVHNDFADWNLLTDGKDITGVLDWDECVASDPISDIACWSTFFEPERMQRFLEGYWSVAEKPSDFEDKMELMRLRYTLSKMTLRVRRYTWDKQDFIKEKIEVGKTHLGNSFDYFGINS